MFFKSLSYKNEQILENFLPDEAYLPLDCSSFFFGGELFDFTVDGRGYGWESGSQGCCEGGNTPRSVERERVRIGRAERTPATSAARFNYTLQTHDMSKSYTSYRLCHLLKVSSRAAHLLLVLCFWRSAFSFRLEETFQIRKASNFRTKRCRR